MFECYQVPSLLTGIDALFSHYHSKPSEQNCLIISVGHHSCHVMPLVNGKIDIHNSSRLNLGGFNLTLYLQRLLQLKYPKHSLKFTFTKCEQVVHRHCRFAKEYRVEAMKWFDEKFYEANVLRINMANNGSGTSAVPVADTFLMKAQRLFANVEANLVKRREKMVSNSVLRRELIKVSNFNYFTAC